MRRSGVRFPSAPPSFRTTGCNHVEHTKWHRRPHASPHSRPDCATEGQARPSLHRRQVRRTLKLRPCYIPPISPRAITHFANTGQDYFPQTIPGTAPLPDIVHFLTGTPDYAGPFMTVGAINVPIHDQREISFDAPSLLAIVAASSRVAQAVGLPPGAPSNVTFEVQERAVAFLYPDEEAPVVIGSSALAALLISYCMSAGIRIPRQLDREVRVDPEAVVFVCTTSYMVASAVLTTIRPGIARMQSAVPGSAAKPE